MSRRIFLPKLRAQEFLSDSIEEGEEGNDILMKIIFSGFDVLNLEIVKVLEME